MTEYKHVCPGSHQARLRRERVRKELRYLAYGLLITIVLTLGLSQLAQMMGVPW